MNPLDMEKHTVAQLERVPTQESLDSNNASPGHDPVDPINWTLVVKCGVLLQVCLLAALGTLNTAIINPAYAPMAAEFGITTVRASYQTTIAIAMNGVGPFLWVPLANVYGRRPIYVFTTVLGFASAVGAAFSHNFSQLLVARAFNGLFPAAMSLGAGSVVDLFVFHQSHIAPIVGGLLGQYLGWRWCFKFAAILNAAMLVLIFFCLPETLYVRTSEAAAERKATATTFRRLRLFHRHPGRTLRLSQFVVPTLVMAKHPSVLFPALCYAAQYGFASILPAVTVAHIFSAAFGFNTLQIGLAYGGALVLGGCLGELAGGMVVDAVVRREGRRSSKAVRPEARLKAIWTGEILVPAGLLIYGFCIQYRVHWSGALIGMGTACFGMQVITTTCYTYAVDCYKPQAGDVSQLFNFFRQAFGMTFAFYVIPLGETIGFQFMFILFAGVGSILAFIPIVALMFKGPEWRGMSEELVKSDDDGFEAKKDPEE
ncbi:hypothetical protein PLICRDRAFT_173783 [Plicaturopsis crispa FD-325 SS-3]|nr:hypothetical protein PLICRDRAFT_173783 [Plicaturopsis crispa FD-325 SS-3]